MIPELLEVCRHCDQPLADRIVQQELILLARSFSFFSCLGQRAQFVVPFRLEGVGNQSIARIDQHCVGRPAFINSSDQSARVKVICDHATIFSCLPTSSATWERNNDCGWPCLQARTPDHSYDCARTTGKQAGTELLLVCPIIRIQTRQPISNFAGLKGACQASPDTSKILDRSPTEFARFGWPENRPAGHAYVPRLHRGPRICSRFCRLWRSSE